MTTQKPRILGIPFALCLSAILFCLWISYSGDQSSFCFTAGCSLFQNTASSTLMWQIGATAFSALALCTLLGKVELGFGIAALTLSADIILLVIMFFTAPCISCLTVGLLFCLVFLSFQREQRIQNVAWTPETGKKKKKNPLFFIWLLFFCLNIATVVKTELFSLWTLSDNLPSAKVHVYFSPSCSSCRQAIDSLSGRIDVAFLPVAENERDYALITAIQKELSFGANMKEALLKAQDYPEWNWKTFLTPQALFLRFRLLRNKAHVFLAGSHVVPFLEYHGLPSFLVKKPDPPKKEQPKTEKEKEEIGDPNLPIESISGFCGPATDCQNEQETSWQKR